MGTKEGSRGVAGKEKLFFLLDALLFGELVDEL